MVYTIAEVMEANLIKKEDIKDKVHFVHAEVLNTDEARQERKRRLENAMRLGNGYKGKITIVFATDEGDLAVETTVWATTDSGVQLKGDVHIPIHSIREVII